MELPPPAFDQCATCPEHRRAPERPRSPIPFRERSDDGMPGPSQYRGAKEGPAPRQPTPPPTQVRNTNTRGYREVQAPDWSTKKKTPPMHVPGVQSSSSATEGIDSNTYRGTRVKARERTTAVVESTREAYAPMCGPTLPPSPRRLQYEKRCALQREVRKNLARIISDEMRHSEFGISKREILGRNARRAQQQLAKLEPPASDRRQNAFARGQKADPMYLGARVEDEGIDPKYFEDNTAPYTGMTEQDRTEWGAELAAVAAKAEVARDLDIEKWAGAISARVNTTANVANDVANHNGHIIPRSARKLSREDQETFEVEIENRV